jgi:hypothetical protein
MKKNIKLGYVVLFTPIIALVGILFYVNPAAVAKVLACIFGIGAFLSWLDLVLSLFGVGSKDTF